MNWDLEEFLLWSDGGLLKIQLDWDCVNKYQCKPRRRRKKKILAEGKAYGSFPLPNVLGTYTTDRSEFTHDGLPGFKRSFPADVSIFFNTSTID